MLAAFLIAVAAGLAVTFVGWLFKRRRETGSGPAGISDEGERNVIEDNLIVGYDRALSLKGKNATVRRNRAWRR